MNIKAIIHGKSVLKGRLSREIINAAEKHALPYQIWETTAKGDAAILAEKADSDTLLVSCGGDGTNNEIVNALMKKQADYRPVFSFLPAGSGNDFCRTTGHRTAEEMIDRFAKNAISFTDVLQLSAEKEECFALNMSTMGIGAEIAKTVNKRKFKLPPELNYYTAILYWLGVYRSPELQIEMNEHVYKSACLMLAIGNGKYAGNGLGLCPQAELNDGLFGGTIFGKVGIRDFLRYQKRLQRCEVIKDDRLHYLSANEANISVVKGKLPIETDGEFFTTLQQGQSLKVKLISAALRII
ncbi:MAG: YegS/Rv2252/BmrU family lipid kinase [Salibacteraceae bacterium]